MMRSTIRFTLTLVVALAACGDSGSADRAEEPAEQPAPPLPRDSVVPGVPAPRDSTRPPGSIGQLSDSEIVLATIADGTIRLSRDTVPPGEVTVMIENRASAPCSLELSSQFAGRSRSAPVRPGGTASMSMSLATAPYNLFCADVAGAERPTRDTVRLIIR